MSRQRALELAAESLRANRPLDKLRVCPGPRGADIITPGRPRRRGQHLHWYIGQFEHREGISGPVRCPEVPVFRTEREAKDFLARVLDADKRST